MAKSSTGTAPQAQEAVLCSKCGVNPRSKSHDWCNQCKAENQARYAEARDTMFFRKGYVAGIAGLREVLLKRLREANPSVTMTVREFISFTENEKGPEIPATPAS